MSKTVSLNFAFTGGVTQDTEVVVLGESSSGLSPDSRQAVNVTVEELNSILAVTGETPALTSTSGLLADATAYPGLAFKLSDSIKEKVEAVGMSAPEVARILTSTKFTSWLANIPHEAIKSVEVGSVSTSYGDLFSQIASPAGSTPATDPKVIAVQNMFEQVLAANRLAPIDADPRNVATTFVAGDKITVYVSFGVTKTRTYKIDTEVESGATATAKFYYGGAEKTLGSAAQIVDCDDNVTATLVAYDLTATA